MDKADTPKPAFLGVAGNKWMMISAVLGILLIVSIGFNFTDGITGMAIMDKNKAAEKAVSYITNNLGQRVQLGAVTESNGLYNIEINKPTPNRKVKIL